MFIAIFVLLTLLLDAAFEPDEAVTEEMLTAYSRKSDLDTVIVGSSVGNIYDGDLFSSLTGSHAFNMCTPSQGLSGSLTNIKLASSQHKMSDVILILTYDSINSESYSGIDMIYDRVFYSKSPFFVRMISNIKRNMALSLAADTIGTEKSVNIWIPWENGPVHGFESVRNNLSKRFNRLKNGKPLGSDIAFDLNIRVYEDRLGNFNDEDLDLLESDLEKLSGLSVPEGMADPDKFRQIAQICTYCRDNGISFYIVMAPHRSDYYDRTASFRDESGIVDGYIKDFVSKRGFVYYNTEDDPEIHQIFPDGYFYDWVHLESKYGGPATEYLAGIIRRYE